MHLGSWGTDSRQILRRKEIFANKVGKAILAKAGITNDVEGLDFCILGHATEKKPKTESHPNRTFYL